MNLPFSRLDNTDTSDIFNNTNLGDTTLNNHESVYTDHGHDPFSESDPKNEQNKKILRNKCSKIYKK